MRNFGAADRMTKMMERFGLQEGEALEHPWLNKSVETAQKRVEQRNYLIRKRALEFDDVMNKQREVVYGWRNEAINTDDPRPLHLRGHRRGDPREGRSPSSRPTTKKTPMACSAGSTRPSRSASARKQLGSDKDRRGEQFPHR